MANDFVVPSEHVPVGLPALPALTPEAKIRPGAGQSSEPLVDLAGTGLTLLHSYAEAGWRHAVREQFLRAGVAERLVRAREALPPGYGLAVFDGWRPLELQRELYASLGEDGVAAPSTDPATPPPHLTGGAVDLTLTWNGGPLALGTPFDDFGAEAATAAFEPCPGPVRELRRLLYWALRAQGLVVLAEEWWHFEFGTRLWSALTGRPPHYRAVTPS